MSPQQQTSTRAASPGELVFGLGVAGLGVLALVGARSIVVPISTGALGPRVLPYLVGGAMVLAGLAVVVDLLRGRSGGAEQGEDIDLETRTDWLTVGKLVGLIGVHVVLITPLGWPVAAAVLFTGAAWTFGARPRLRAALIGVGLAFVLQLAFAGGLGVSLPPGPLLEGVPFLHG